MSNDDEFLAGIAAAPDDPAHYLVYSDALMLRGDPRGDLISIQHALETAEPSIAADLRRRESEIIAANTAEWLGPLLPYHDAVALRWRFGFVHAARIFADHAPQVIGPLFELPAAHATLAELRLGIPSDMSLGVEMPPVQSLVDAIPWESALRRLHLCDVDLHHMHDAPPIALPEQAKHLDKLVVQTPELELHWDASPAKLRHLELRVPRFASLPVREWPNLESLVVWTEDPTRLLSIKAPKLRHLALCGTTNTPALVTELVKHPLTKQLESLSLVGGVLTMTKTLQAIAGNVKLDVRWNRLGKDEREKLAAFGAEVKPQRRGGAALTNREALGELWQKVTSTEPSETLKAYRKFVASTPDPSWIYDERDSVASELPNDEKAAALGELANELRDELLRGGETDRAELCYRIADTYETLALGYQCETWLWQCVQDARWYEMQALEIRALGLIGTTRMRRGDPKIAAQIMDLVLAYYLEHGNKDQQAWALRQRGNVDLVRSEFDAAEGFYRRALELYRERKDKHNEGIVLSELAGVLWSRHDFEGAVAMIRQSITMRPSESIGMGSCYYNLGAVLNGMSRLDEAIEAGQKSLEIFRKHKRRDGEGQALSLLGELMQRSNKHADAEKMLDEALVCHRERGAIRESGITLGNLARVALDRGQWAKARGFAEEAVELHRECSNKYNEGMQMMDLVDAAIGERRLDDALALIDEGLKPLLAINNLPGIGSLKCRRGYVAHLRGAFADAELHYDEAIADSKAGNYPETVGWTQMYRAVIRAQEGRHADASALLDEAHADLKDSTQGLHTLEVARAVVARFAGKRIDMPKPLGFDALLIASFQ